MTTVSGIVTIYKTHDLAVRAVRSLSEQTKKPSEIVIVDATPWQDRPHDLEEKIANLRNAAIPYCRDKNPIPLLFVFLNGGSTAEARNIGARTATGDVLAFLDGDDCYLPNKIELSLTMLEMADGTAFSPASIRNAIVTSGMIYVDQRVKPETRTEVFGHETTLETLSQGCSAFSNYVVPRDVALRHPFNPHWRVCEDYAWYVELAYAGVRFITVPIPLHVYHKRPGSKTVECEKRKLDETKQIKIMAEEYHAIKGMKNDA